MLKIGDSVRVDLTGMRFVTCTDCGEKWLIAGHNNVTCPECGGRGVIGRLVTLADVDSPEPKT